MIVFDERKRNVLESLYLFIVYINITHIEYIR